MKDDLTLCAEVFLKEQTKLYDEPVAQDIEEAKEFLDLVKKRSRRIFWTCELHLEFL